MRGESEKEIVTHDGKTIVQPLNCGQNFPMPGRSTLSRYKSKLKYALLLSEKQKKRVQDLIARSSHFGIGWDETDIRGGLVYCNKNGKIYGLPNPFLAAELKEKMKDFDAKSVSYSMGQFILIFPNGLTIPVASYCLPPEGCDQFIYGILKDLFKIFDPNGNKCLFTVSDGSYIGEYVDSKLRIEFPNVIHVFDYVHLMKNTRNRLLEASVAAYLDNEEENAEDDKILFNLQTLIQLIFEIENGEASPCKISMSVLHPRDKMDVEAALELFQQKVIECCKSSKSKSINAMGAYLSRVKQFYDFFHENKKERSVLPQIAKYFQDVDGLANTGTQLNQTLLGVCEIMKRDSNFNVSAITTNPLENFFSIIKGSLILIYFFFSFLKC